MEDSRQDLGEWEAVAGEDLTITVNITVDGVGVDLTTYGTAWAGDLRQYPSSPTSVAFAVDDTNASTGTLVLSLTDTQTATMATGAKTLWQFDLEATGGADSPQYPFRGTVIFDPSYTH